MELTRGELSSRPSMAVEPQCGGMMTMMYLDAFKHARVRAQHAYTRSTQSTHYIHIATDTEGPSVRVHTYVRTYVRTVL